MSTINTLVCYGGASPCATSTTKRGADEACLGFCVSRAARQKKT